MESETTTRYHFPTLEAETRSKMKYIEIRLATLERMKAKDEETARQLSTMAPPIFYDIFKPVPYIEITPVFLSGIAIKQRIPSCIIPNGNAPIKTQGSMVPKEVQIIPRTTKAPKKHEIIKTPDFREITAEEDPRNFIVQQPLDKPITDAAIQRIIETHQQLELIEDMVRMGSETRVTGAGSLLRVYNLHEDYKIDKKELKKIHRYTPKMEDTVIPPNWPERVYDVKNTPITEQQMEELQNLTKEWEIAHQSSIEAKQAANKRPTKSSKNPKFKVWVGDFITDASSDITENEDFILGFN